MFKRIVLGLLSLLTFSIFLIPLGAYAQPISAANPGQVETPFLLRDLTNPLNTSNAYALYIGSNGLNTITWQTIYSAAPTTTTVLLEGSNDCSTFATIDSSTNNAGEIRSVSGSWKCFRLNNTAVTGGGGKTLSVYVVYSRGISYTPGVRVLCSGRALALTTSGTVKQTLATCTIPADSFPTKYTTLQIRAFFTHAVNVNTTTSGIDIGATVIVARPSTGSGEQIAGLVTCEVGSALLNCHKTQSVSSGTTSGNIYVSAVPLNFSIDNLVSIVATTPVAAGDSVLNSYTVTLLKE